MSATVINPTEIFLPRQHQLAIDLPSVRVLTFYPEFTAVLFGQRNSGEFELPGGKPDPGEDKAVAGVREVKEETGVGIEVIANPISITCDEERQFEKDGILRQYVGYVMVGRMTKGPGKPKPQLGELIGAEWLELYNAPHIIEQDKMVFRKGTEAALKTILPAIQNKIGTLVTKDVVRLMDAIKSHESLTYTPSYLPSQVA